jgi:protein SON
VLEPLKMRIKLKRRGLQATEEKKGHQQPVSPSGVKKTKYGGFANRHPSSALNEAWTKRSWGTPAFHLVKEEGHAHKKTFLFKVKINGLDYQPTVKGSSKKLAKAEFAKWSLDPLGLIIS